MNNFHDYVDNWHTFLSKIAKNGKFKAAIFSAISENESNKYINNLNRQLEQLSYELLPEIKLLNSDSQVQTAAYSSSKETIYVSENWIEETSQYNFFEVITEELGHHIDSKVNSKDTSGDEGYLFSAKILEKDLSSDLLKEVLSENDYKIITIDGEEQLIEQNSSNLLTVAKNSLSDGLINTPYTLNKSDLITGVNSSELTIENLTVNKGTIFYNNNATWTYTPEENWYGDVEISYETNDGSLNGKILGKSFYFELGNSTWMEAQNKSEDYGGNLVSINSQIEQDFINEAFASIDDGDHGKWIGFTDKDQEGNWIWTDGSSVDFTNWNPSEPSNGGYNNPEHYGMIWANYGNQLNNIFPVGSWNDVSNNGDGNISGIAEIPFFRFEDSIYLKLGPSTWDEAQAAAKELGGNLVSINSQEEQDFIVNTFLSQDDGENGKWIGLNDKDQEGNWVWSDGSSVDFTSWNTGEPNDEQDDGQYAADNVLISQQNTPWSTSHIGSWNDHTNDINIYGGTYKASGIVEIKTGITEMTASLKINPLALEDITAPTLQSFELSQNNSVDISQGDGS
ncbi:hypothetical protein CU309_05130, partial [Prochlorococcus marinus str. MU1405]